MDDTKKAITSDALETGGKLNPAQGPLKDTVTDETRLIPDIHDAKTELLEAREKAYSGDELWEPDDKGGDNEGSGNS